MLVVFNGTEALAACFFDFLRDLRSGMLCFGVHLRMQQLDRYLSKWPSRRAETNMFEKQKVAFRLDETPSHKIGGATVAQPLDPET